MSIYDELEIREIITANGNVTRFGGSLMPLEAIEAMKEASKRMVHIDELQKRIGEKISELVGVEATYVSSGAAAGLTLATAACITGKDPAKIRQLPFTQDLKNEVVIHKTHRNKYDMAIKQVGVNFKEIGLSDGRVFPWELEEAINEKTAAVAYILACANKGSLSLEETIKIAHNKGVPVIVDAAAELPPADNLSKFVEMGADIAVFSGGKGLRGPQATGLVLGKRSLIEACALNGNPNLSFGRPMKVAKEEMAGLLTALKVFLREDYRKEMVNGWRDQMEYLRKELSDLPGIEVWVEFPQIRQAFPTKIYRDIPILYMSIDKELAGISKRELMRKLEESTPPIYVATFPMGIIIRPMTLQEGQEEIVATRIREIME